LNSSLATVEATYIEYGGKSKNTLSSPISHAASITNDGFAKGRNLFGRLVP